MKAIILCGGLGTRLRECIGEKQKAMALIKGTPFLVILIEYLKSQGLKDYIFACGYKYEEIKEYFRDGKEYDIHIDYAIEKEPLGTGGAIKNALPYVDEDRVYALNGDTLFKADYKKLFDNMNTYNTDLSIIVKDVKSVLKENEQNRYGNITIKDNLITDFIEKPDKDNARDAFINGGIYIIKKDLIKTIKDGKVSFENELMPDWLKKGKKIGGVIENYSFVDIGTKESYKKINE